MLGSTSRTPLVKELTLFQIRYRSWVSARGVPFPILLTQRIGLSFANSRMMCTFESGSPPQSLEKTTMSLPESALTARCSTFADILDSPPTADKSTAKQAQRRAKTPTKIPKIGRAHV